MKINSVALKNIRSYTDAKIEFSNGTTLLSGDIGCGKSTVLYAIDFALFGLRPGTKSDDLPGAALLRHGTNEGHVVLEFSVDGKEVVIKRTLVRKNSTVSQSAGTITVNGVTKDLTATELKSEILALLGYPEKLLRANKSLLFRYTIYTPQEQMKEILFEKEQDRLDTLRNVFGMDKYKKIQDNASVFALELRRLKARLEGIYFDLPKKEEELRQAKEELESIKKSLAGAHKTLEKIQDEYAEKKEETDALKKKIEEMQKLKSDMDVRKNTHTLLEKRAGAIKGELKELLSRLSKTDEKGAHEKILLLEKELAGVGEKKKELERKEEEKTQLDRKLREAETRKKTAQETIDKIGALDECPTCGQDVDESYKGKIRDCEGKKIANFDRIIDIHKESLLKVTAVTKNLKTQIEEIQKKEKEKLELSHALKEITELKEAISKKEDEHQKTFDEAQALLKGIAQLGLSLKEFDAIGKKAVQKEQELEKVREIFVEAKSLNARFEQARDDITKSMASTAKEIKSKKKAKKDFTVAASYETWLSSSFIPLAGVIEKHVLAVIRQEFNTLFSQWFSILVEDENLSSTIDDKFTPIVMQNSYEMSYSHLSGGEKTAIALAYRLALNKVINALSETIRTKDLLILDEPTDGFSTEQLDRVRDVLDELKLKQILIVSHEAKMADFVDDVIRFRKLGGISGVGFQ